MSSTPIHRSRIHRACLGWGAGAMVLLVFSPIPAQAEPKLVSPPQSAKADDPTFLNQILREQSSVFENWDIGGQFRARYEMKDDAGSFPSNDFVSVGKDADNSVMLFREKLHIGWKPQSWVRFYVEGRGSQALADDRDPSPEHDAWDLHQAFIELGDPKHTTLSLQIGRQEMKYGDQRFIGVADWGNTGRSFDAARLRWRMSKASWVDVFTSRVVIPRDSHFNVSNDYDQFSGVYASSRDLISTLETEAFFLARNTGAGSPEAVAPGFGGPSERDVYTYGVRVKSLPGAFGGWDFTFEGAGQFGDVVTDGVSRDLQSFALTGSLGYTFEKAWGKPRIGVGYDYGSGDSDPSDGTQETFEQLFGTNHALYGFMDLVGLRNTNSPRISFSLKPSKKWSISADYLLFWLADTADSFYPESGSARSGNGYGKNPQYDSFVGSELDIVAKFTPTPWAEFQIGYGHFFVGDYIRSSVGSVAANGGATGADWFYVQASFEF